MIRWLLMFSLSVALEVSVCCSVNAQFGQRIHDSIPLRFGYCLLIRGYETDCVDCGGNDVNTLTLMKDHKKVFGDTNNQYIKDEVYPLLLHFGMGHDEILLRFGDAPSLDEVIRLFIKDNSLVKIDTLPSFDRGASDLAGDGKPRFAAIWDLRQEWDDSLGVQLTTYEPILYYKLTDLGLILDSTMTRSANKRIYGKFYGYEPTEEKSFPAARVNRRFASEWKRIKNARKLTLNGF